MNVISKKEIARQHLESAYSEYLKKDYIPALHFAGAAEFLGLHLKYSNSEFKNSQNILLSKPGDFSKYQSGFNVGSDKEIINTRNYAKNSIIHFNDPYFPFVLLNEVLESRFKINDAIENL